MGLSASKRLIRGSRIREINWPGRGHWSWTRSTSAFLRACRRTAGSPWRSSRGRCTSASRRAVERVRRLEKAGYIVGYRAELSPTHLGQNLLAYVQVALDRTTPEVFDRFRTAMEVLEFVQEANMVAGGFDYSVEDPRAGHEGVPQRAQQSHRMHQGRTADAYLFRDGRGQELEQGARAGTLTRATNNFCLLL